ncbi:LysR substrate-binding domain-containing protein [Mycolicibacterium litorale]|uniref:Probable hydrogen peroxide-inducible genes activator n=1 Tax=Mycolicibacterium litorale TaxID=758802 RepID=A0AAD1IMY8_9MYCO|nr:LysR substrate-binding domain-containing protein [Mycolicibacterium litorale]MCV7415297.1 LysR family transcriptional regulator [Mycolicibacterium litorale]TDY08551.1 LysR family transcriptional regulator [Mycolicibacterium litorale]BBY16477.1 LysR family transcriptional regulator [Mycolicibacterium litorale]
MDITDLRYLIAVVDAGSLSRAAVALRISQPALSQRMTHLEDELGVRLLERGPRGVLATEAGQDFYRDAHRMVRQFDQLSRAVSDHRQIRGLVAVGLPSAVATQLAAPLYSWVRQQVPGVRLELFESMSGYIEELFDRGRMDLAVVYRDQPRERPGDIALYSEELYLVGDPGRPVASDTTIRLPELADVPLVAPGIRSSLRVMIEQALREHRISPTVVADVESLSTMVRIAQTGDACALLPLSSATAASVPIRHVIDPPLRRFAMVRTANELSAPREAVDAVCRGIAEVTRQLARAGKWQGICMTESP